nr:hypothetical protein [Tanacetum cinerariifolium]
MKKMYCLVVTDDYSRFTWVFFLSTKDETSGILRQYSVARTPQQNGVAERRNKTLIEVARTMLAYLKLPTTFWAEAVNTACYVQNRVLVVKPHNKTPYKLFHGRTPALSFIKPFGCHVSILNTLDPLANLMTADPPFSQDPKSSQNNRFQPLSDSGKKVDEDPIKESECRDQAEEDNVNNTNNVNAASTNGVNTDSENISNELPFDLNMSALEDISTFKFSSDHEDDDEEADMNNMDTTIQVSLIPTTRIHKDHPLDQVIRDLHSTTQTRNMSNNLVEHRGIVIRNKARLVTQGYTQEKRIDYDEVFAPVERIDAIRLFLAYASFKDFVMYQMDVKSAFVYGKIEKKVYVCQPPGFEDPDFFDKVYKVENALYGLHQAPRACTMAFAIICLATNQKFKFSKDSFESMVKNLDNVNKFLMYPRKSKRKDTELPQTSGPTTNIADEAVSEEMNDSLERAATTASSLEVGQDSGNINKTKSKATLNEPSSIRTSLGINTPLSDEGSLKLKELTKLCTNLHNSVLDLETTKTTQAIEIDSLKRRVKKLEKKQRLRTHKLKILYKVSLTPRVDFSNEASLGEDASKQERIIHDIDVNEEITLVDENVENQGRFNDQEDAEMLFDVVDDLGGEDVFVSQEVPLKEVRVVDEVNAVSTVTTTTAIINDITLAKALMEIKSAKPKADKVVIQEIEQGTTTTTTAATIITAASIRPKAKGLVIHKQEQAPTLRVFAQQLTLVKVQDKGKGKMIEPEPIKKLSKKDQLMLDEELAFKLQAEEEEKEEERLAREKAQQIKEVNIAWDDIQAKIDADYQLAQRLQAKKQEELTDEKKARLFVQFLEKRRKFFAAKRTVKRRNIPLTRAQQRSIMCTYLKNIEGWKTKSLKNKSFVDIQELFNKAMKRVNTFVDYMTELVVESSKEAEVEVTKGSSKRDGEELEQENAKKQKMEMIKMLKIFNREDLEVLWRLVKARFEKIKLVDYMDNLLPHNLKTMFEHYVKDNSIPFYLLVEKMYPFRNHTLRQMFNNVKLQVDYNCEMAFELLRLVKKQLKEGYVSK